MCNLKRENMVKEIQKDHFQKMHHPQTNSRRVLQYLQGPNNTKTVIIVPDTFIL